jgi:hypothetical protein
MHTRLLGAAGIACFGGVLAVDAHAWPDTYLGRLETFALIEELNREALAAHRAREPYTGRNQQHESHDSGGG